MSVDRDQLFELLASAAPRGLQPMEIAIALGLDKNDRHRVRVHLQELVRMGVVVRHGKLYAVKPEVQEPASAAAFVGVLQLSPVGRGTVDVGDGEEAFLIDGADLDGALDGDTVEVRAYPQLERAARVARVIARGRRRVTGTLWGPPWRLEPDDPRLQRDVVVVDPDDALPGEMVLAAIEAYPSRVGEAVRVRVLERLGAPGELTTEVAKILAAQGVVEEFPEEVLAEAARVPAQVRPEDLLDRVDLRDRPFLTIDPPTARDFDDAVCVERLPSGGHRLWVAVADVSHYVREGTALDREACQRGCSVYLPDRAIPMLPHVLSSAICSLVPGEDRLAMVVRLELQAGGRVTESESVAAVIRSRARLDYPGVAAALEAGAEAAHPHYAEHVAQLEELARLATLLRARRMRRGSLDLDLPEAHVVLDEDDPRLVRDIVSSRASPEVKRAYNLIEELMLAANEAIGHAYVLDGRPTIWRIHPPPEPAALYKLCGWLGAYGIPATVEQLSTPKGMAAVLRQVAAHRASRPLSYLGLRALKQANYNVSHQGHFGLASEAYLHFTSPIRRYPDLVAHRLLKQLLHQKGLPAGGGGTAEAPPVRTLQAAARQASAQERRALDVERQVHALYTAAFMRDRVGDEAWGTIITLTSFGMFVALDEPHVEGLVKFEQVGEWLEYDPERLRLFGRESRRVVSLGDRLRVRIAGANLVRRQLDFELLEWGSPAMGPAVPHPGRSLPRRHGRSIEGPPRQGAPGLRFVEGGEPPRRGRKKRGAPGPHGGRGPGKRSRRK
ncbi:MAG: VacB/RNase II family 3'-5' exoribonuclease [Deltaproteobacteria bacterium]|nr:VacB/RNase II family 3'-5' exoribonuclease [Deltaproteobacteria bacterium]